MSQAFGTPIHSFVVNGEQHWANVGDPTIPSALAPVVSGINSMHNFQKQAQNIPLGTYSAVSRRRLSPSPAYTTNGSTNRMPDYAIAPYDFAAIYHLLPLWNASLTPINGTGQTVAIVGRSDINPADAAALWRFFGLDGTHAPQPKLVVTYNGPNPGVTTDEAEDDIDTQWSGAVAPGATINYVVSASTTTTDGVDLSALYIVDNNLAPVLSESYGACEASMGTSGVQFYGALWQQAAAKGISVFVSSGDSGAAGCDDPGATSSLGLQVNGIASTPFNAAVGGTDFNQFQAWSTYWDSSNDPITKQSAKGYIPETPWNDSCTNPVVQSLPGDSTNVEANCNNSTFKSLLDSTGGGGGQSSTWLKPACQTGTPNDNARDLPDISLFASNGFLDSYYLVCQSRTHGGACDFKLLGVPRSPLHSLLASWHSSIKKLALRKASRALPCTCWRPSIRPRFMISPRVSRSPCRALPAVSTAPQPTQEMRTAFSLATTPPAGTILQPDWDRSTWRTSSISGKAYPSHPRPPLSR